MFTNIIFLSSQTSIETEIHHLKVFAVVRQAFNCSCFLILQTRLSSCVKQKRDCTYRKGIKSFLKSDSLNKILMLAVSFPGQR